MESNKQLKIPKPLPGDLKDEPSNSHESEIECCALCGLPMEDYIELPPDYLCDECRESECKASKVPFVPYSRKRLAEQFPSSDPVPLKRAKMDAGDGKVSPKAVREHGDASVSTTKEGLDKGEEIDMELLEIIRDIETKEVEEEENRKNDKADEGITEGDGTHNTVNSEKEECEALAAKVAIAHVGQLTCTDKIMATAVCSKRKRPKRNGGVVENYKYYDERRVCNGGSGEYFHFFKHNLFNCDFCKQWCCRCHSHHLDCCNRTVCTKICSTEEYGKIADCVRCNLWFCIKQGFVCSECANFICFACKDWMYIKDSRIFCDRCSDSDSDDAAIE
jgi:hypothetical protein